MGKFIKTNWKNNSTDTPISADNLNKIEDGIVQLEEDLSYFKAETNEVHDAINDSITRVVSSIDTIANRLDHLSPDYIPKVTYETLVSLRNSSQLVPGKRYRLVDYECTTTQPNTQTANHRFDIILTAETPNALNEVAYACHNELDYYFNECNLAAWELKYTLDNNKLRFSWAKTDGSGKGVIYYMKDEYGNEAPYDFKNILFLRKRITGAKYVHPELNSATTIGSYIHEDPAHYKTDGKYGWFYTFTTSSRYHNMDGYRDATVDEDDKTNYHHNVIKPYIEYYSCKLNNIVFNANWDYDIAKNDIYNADAKAYNNYFGDNCKDITLNGKVYQNIFQGNNVNIMMEEPSSNIIGYNCQEISSVNSGDSVFDNVIDANSKHLILIASNRTHIGQNISYLTLDECWNCTLKDHLKGYSTTNHKKLSGDGVNFIPSSHPDIIVD